MNSKYKFIKKSSSRILLNMVGKYFQVYQGKRFINIYVSELMVGKFFGEFVRSRKRHIYNKKKQKVGQKVNASAFRRFKNKG